MAHRRRGVGISRTRNSRPGGSVRTSATTERRSMQDKLQKKADEMHALSLQTAIDTIESLQVKLADFAKKHQSDIQDDPAFRQQFLQMCAPLGVDPLV